MSKRTTKAQIIEEADLLFYRQGFEKTSFADIATKVNISRGNFYHHFKSKDDILNAVIEHRFGKTQTMLESWEAKGKTPSERIQCFIHILIMNITKIKIYGCSLGTLSSELSKLEHASKKETHKIFDLFRAWLKKQFTELGCQDHADRHAMHLLARSQGIAALANAYQDEAFVNREVQLLIDWVTSIEQQ